MNYLDKLNRDYPFKEQPTFIKKLSMLVDRSIDVLKAYKQLTGQEPPSGGNLDLKILDELLNAEIINTAVRPAYINAIKGRLADNLFNGVIQPQKDKDHFIWLAKSRQTQKVIVKAAVKLRYDALLESKEIVSAPKLTPQDREVYDAVSTLWQAGNAVMTYAMIYRVMTGGRYSRHKVPKEAYAQIETALNHCNGRLYLRVVADETREAERAAKRFSGVDCEDEPLIMFRRATVCIKGFFVRGIIVKEQPILLRWALRTHEIDTKPLRMKAIGTYRTQSLKELIVQRVSKRMTQGKNGKLTDNQNVIRLDWLLKQLGEEEASDKRKRNLRDNARKLLEELSGSSQKRPQEALIAGYSLVKNGRKISGFRIDLLKK